MARVLAEGSIEELDNAAIVRISLTRGVLPDVFAQLSCLRFAVTEWLWVKVGSQGLELRFGEGLASKDRAKIGVRDSGYVLEPSLTELDAWLKFLASCYWHERPSVDHVDLFVFYNTTDKAWQQSSDIDKGDRLLTADGGTLGIEGLDWLSARADTAYNLSISDVHTYYARGDRRICWS